MMKLSPRLMILMAALPVFCLLSLQAQAAARSYSKPSLLGQPVHHCLADGNTCGKPAADAFCRLNGYENALNFRLQRDPGQISTSIVVDSGRLLKSPEAQPFQMVKCWRPNDLPSTVQFDVENIISPKLCDLGQDCRKLAADQWCAQKGYALGASAYQIASDRILFRTISCATL
jgi:hypothetical protein